MKRLFSASEVQVLRCVASQIGGCLLVESEAPDKPTLERWFEAKRINCEWIMRIELDGQAGTIQEV